MCGGEGDRGAGVWGGGWERSTFLFYDVYTLPHKWRHPIITSNHLQGRTKVALPLWLLMTLEGEGREMGEEEKKTMREASPQTIVSCTQNNLLPSVSSPSSAPPFSSAHPPPSAVALPPASGVVLPPCWPSFQVSLAAFVAVWLASPPVM